MDLPNYCRECGASVTPGSRFCANCGAVLASLATPAAKPPSAADDGSLLRRDRPLPWIGSLVLAVTALLLTATIGFLVVTQLLPMMGIETIAAASPSAVSGLGGDEPGSRTLRPSRTARPRATPPPTPRPTPEPTPDADAIASARVSPLLLSNQAVGQCLLVSATSARYEQEIPSGFGVSTSATPGYKFAIIIIVVENFCPSSVYTNPFDFTLVSADGRIHNHDTATYALDALVFEGGTLFAATQASGALIYQIVEDDAPALLVFDLLVDHVEVDLLHGEPAGQ